jgi:threonine/homoserine/homoserine lactone efflux protein
MYSVLLLLHSLFRWLVLITLIYTLYRAWTGYRNNKPFTKTDNAFRHWTATVAHIQLMIGFTLYLKSPLVKSLFARFKEGVRHSEMAFFGIAHILLMLVAIVIITIGSAMAKRKTTDREKFLTIIRYYSIALLLIFLAIPWPFSPFAGRPYIRII